MTGLSTIALAGARTDSLLGYLKALGILRLVGRNLDPQARASWRGNILDLHTRVTQTELLEYFVVTYAPTPIMNPWNSGSGFDGKADTAASTLSRIAQTSNVRWAKYRKVIEFIEREYLRSGKRAVFLADGEKYEFVKDLRRRCPEEFLAWLDAALVLGPEKSSFPFLLGSGGNDGRLDFSVNFAARALDVCETLLAAESQLLLADSLFESADARLLADAAIGQFSPRHAAGANASNGFDAVSLVNPWDYLLMVEGALLFTGALGRRSDNGHGRPLFPFALHGTPGGYGSSSAVEKTRGEMWLPVWAEAASLAGIVDLLRKGRIDAPSDGARGHVRGVSRASEAAAAVLTRGLAMGVSRIERISFIERNGLAFVATALGSINVRSQFDTGIALLSRDVLPWVERVRYKASGSAMRAALRAYDEELFALSTVAIDQRPRALQKLLIAINEIDAAIAKISSGDDLPTIPTIGREILSGLDDQSVEHRVAAAIASYGAHSKDTHTLPELRVAPNNATVMLRELFATRLRLDVRESPAAKSGWLKSWHAVNVEDAVAFLTLSEDRRTNFARLVKAYRLIRFYDRSLRSTAALSDNVKVDELNPSRDTLPDQTVVLTTPRPYLAIPASYAVLKLVFESGSVRDQRLLRLLHVGDSVSVQRALMLAVQRARSMSEITARVRDISALQLTDAAWMASCLAIPLRESSYVHRELLRAALMVDAQMLPAVLASYTEHRT